VTAFLTGLATLTALGPTGGQRRWSDVLAPATRADLPTPASPYGAMTATSAGDLAGATKTQALRARVQRKLSATADAFVHLPGWGLRPARGTLLSASELARVRLRAEKDLAADPDIATVSVSIENAPGGVPNAILFRTQITTPTGETDDFVTNTGRAGA
jgi:hypothetical protein